MIIKTLVEDTTISEDFECEHGLSLYIESGNNKLLFDLGQSDLFIKNARKMNVNINDIQNVVISHGHNDHGGGLEYFLNNNEKAKVYLNYLSFERYYAKRLNDKMEYIGLDSSLVGNPQIKLTHDNCEVAENVWTFSNVIQNHRLPISNNILYVDYNDDKIHDLFYHEQNLVIKEDDKLVLFTGCSHNGILNIIEHFEKKTGRMPDYVIGGFHLSSRTGGCETEEYVQNLAKELLKTNAKFYTCHCTGKNAYKVLKEIMKDNIHYLSTGSEIEI